LGLREYCALAEECGAGLLPEPLIPCSLAARVLAGAELERLIAGDTIIIPAWQERANSLALHGDTVLRDGRLAGRKVFVPMAGGADAFLVTTNGTLALVARDAAGVSLTVDRTQDGGNYGTLTFDGAPAEPIAGDLAEAIEEATLATAAYLLGVMERAFAMTLTYLKTRQQFGKPIGSFQALRHRIADLATEIECGRLLTYEVAQRVDERRGSPSELTRLTSMAKLKVTETAKRTALEGMQMMGGYGYATEYDMEHHVRLALPPTIYAGTNEIQREIISSTLGLRDA